MTGLENIFNALRHVKDDTIIGLAVQQGLKRQEPYAMMDFIGNLQSQAKDNPRAMAGVIGKRAFKKLMAWHP